MQSLKAIFGVTIFFFFLATSSYGADIRIGVVDIQRVAELSSAGKMLKAEFERERGKIEGDMKRKGSEIEALKKKLEREAPVMSKDQRGRKERELDIKIYDFKLVEKRHREEFAKFQNEKLERMKKDILEVVGQIGREEGYHLIIQKSVLGSDVVLYLEGTIDITDKLVRRYNSRF